MRRKTYRDDDWLLDVARGQTVGDCLLSFGIPKASTKPLFAEKLVLLDDVHCTPQTLAHKGSTIRLQMVKERIDYEPVPMDIMVLYEDDDLLILHKPRGLTVNSRNQVSLANGVAHYFKTHGIKRKVRFLNRLDRDTTGCIVIAKSGIAQAMYQQQMDDDRFEKYYIATVEGILDKVQGSLRLPMRRSEDGIHYEVHDEGTMTRTDYEVVSQTDATTTVRIRLYTGKTHQIRVAFAHLGHPLVGDVLYGSQLTQEPLQLQACAVRFIHMRTGEKVEVADERTLV